jgi:hypothetical protein
MAARINLIPQQTNRLVLEAGAEARLSTQAPAVVTTWDIGSRNWPFASV